MKKQKLPQWETILEGVEEMTPVLALLRIELLAGQKAQREGKPKRVAYHMRRTVNILFNLDSYFWSPMFQWAQTEEFKNWQRRRRNAK